MDVDHDTEQQQQREVDVEEGRVSGGSWWW